MADATIVWRWRWALASPNGPPDATMRHVLHVLSLHMDENGGSCWPSVATLAAETALNERTVRRALEGAEADGWIRRSRGGRPDEGRAWRLTHYNARLVKRADTEPAPIPEGEDRESAASGENVRTLTTEGADSDDRRCGHSARLSLQDTEKDTKNPFSPADAAEVGDGSVSPDERSNGKRAGGGSWLDPYATAWRERFGGDIARGRLAKALKPAHDELGADRTLRAWHYYLVKREPDYARPEDFASKAAHWDKESRPAFIGYGDEPFTPALRPPTRAANQGRPATGRQTPQKFDYTNATDEMPADPFSQALARPVATAHNNDDEAAAAWAALDSETQERIRAEVVANLNGSPGMKALPPAAFDRVVSIECDRRALQPDDGGTDATAE